MMVSRISVSVNGSTVSIDSGLTVSDIVSVNGELVGRRFAVSVNGEIVTKSEYSAVVVKEGDCVELVEAIGGG